MVNIGEAKEDGAAGDACANENNTALAVSTMVSALLMDSLYLLCLRLEYCGELLSRIGRVDADSLGQCKAAFIALVRPVHLGIHL
jgi:hypothetical protein